MSKENPLWKDNELQFARLICEMRATFDTPYEEWVALCESMDITNSELNSLMDRAHKVWEEAKSKLPGRPGKA